MHFLVIGCGSIGQRHIKNLIGLGHKVSVCEQDPTRADRIKKLYRIEVFNDLEKALADSEKYAGALICTPTSLHVSNAIKAAKRGLHLFIEKPLSDGVKKISELRRIIKQKRLVAFVGCNIRFLPSLNQVKKLIDAGAIGKVLSVRGSRGFYLPYWRPGQDYTKSYSAQKKLGGGVILDDIHDIDLLYWLFSDVREVFCVTGKISKLKIDTEDIAEIFMRFKTGVIAQIHLDYLQRTYRSNYEFIGEKGVIVWNYITQKIRLYPEKSNRCRVFEKSINASHDSMYIEEIKHFIDCIKGKSKAVNDLKQARDVLKIAFACRESAKRKKMVHL